MNNADSEKKDQDWLVNPTFQSTSQVVRETASRNHESSESIDPSPHMTLDEFLAKNNIQIDSSVKEFCEKGSQFLRNSKDPTHSIDHLERLWGNLDKFHMDAENEGLQIDWNTLTAAISWHDAWRASYFKLSPISLYKSQFQEGSHAANFSSSAMKEAGFDVASINKVVYCILTHPSTWKDDRKTVESRILNDIDELDSWSPERISGIANYLSNPKHVLGKLALTLLKPARNVILSKGSHTYYFASTQKEAQDRYPALEKQVKQFFS